MTVAELIEHLKTLPQGYLVVYRCGSDMAELETHEIRVDRGVRHHNLPDTVRDYRESEWRNADRIKVCPLCKKWLYPSGQWKPVVCPHCHAGIMQPGKAEPEFVDVVQFPGN